MFGKTEQLKEEEMKQTAVEWLINELDKYNKGVSEFFSDVAIKNHARRMDKEQHGNTWDAAIKAHEDRGGVISRSICDFDEYYNERYEGEK